MSAKKRCVYVVFYSTYGHVEKLAREVAKGVEKAGGRSHNKSVFKKIKNLIQLMKIFFQ